MTRKNFGRFESLERRNMFAVVTDWGTFADKPEAWPNGWENMEIEAKWSVSEATLESIAGQFVDDTTFDFDGQASQGYLVNVRNQGVPKQFTDLYYDDPQGTLDGSSHALRHRLRDEAIGGGTPSVYEDIDTLRSYTWVNEWEKVQYKSTPARFDAIWFRTESGGGELAGSGNVLNPSSDVLDTLEGTPGVQSDDPVAHATADHSNLVWLNGSPAGNALQPFLLVEDYRYRVRFELPNEDRYELSLDKVRSCTPDANGDFTVCTDSFEAELEVLIDVENVQVDTEVSELFAIVNWFESNFNLTSSTTSKGGNEVDQFGDFDGDNDLDIDDIDYIWERIVLSQNNGVPDSEFDLDRDGDVDADDGSFLVKNLMDLFLGDANLDGLFNSGDLVTVFAAGEYEDGIANNSTWQDGDWNFDGEFDTSDLVAAFGDGGYSG